jgi:hypothetical protein
MTNMIVSSVTHEYLTPVRCIFNFASALATKVQGDDNKKNAKMIQTTSKLLLAQINMTLDGSLLDQNQFEPAYSCQSI